MLLAFYSQQMPDYFSSDSSELFPGMWASSHLKDFQPTSGNEQKEK
jgi:hypothetical protein